MLRRSSASSIVAAIAAFALCVTPACREAASRACSTAAVFVSSSAGHLAEPPAPDIVAVLDDPLTPGFFDRLNEVIPKDEQTPLQAYRLSKWALNRMCRRRAGVWGAKGARIVSMSPGPIATSVSSMQ